MKHLTVPLRRLWHVFTRTRRARIGLAIIVAVGIILIAVQQTRPHTIPSASYKPLLATIAKGESGGNYNAYFGNGRNTEIVFTSMTIAEVMRWQDDYVQQGKASNAVGKYQFMRTTLAGLVRQLNINPETARFTEAMQDRLAITLMERRGAREFIDKKLTREQFAANLAKEWAALPRMTGQNPAESYYAGDGLNHAKISIDEILQAIAEFERLN